MQTFLCSNETITPKYRYNRVELSLTGKRIAMRYCREQTLNPRRTRDERAVFALPVVTARP